MGSDQRGGSETISHRARSLQGIRFRPSLHERLSSPSSVERTRKGGALRSLDWESRPSERSALVSSVAAATLRPNQPSVEVKSTNA